MTVGAFTSIGENVVIGDETIIYSSVSIYDGSQIGRRCILHSGVVIGSDGYGFVAVGGRHRKIPQIGIVRIEDDVEIGSNSTVDRAALGETVIGEGTKIDNLVQIGHNVRIGKHCLIVAQVGIAGSTELGDYVVIAGQAGVAGHLKIGNGAQVGGRAFPRRSGRREGRSGSPADPLPRVCPPRMLHSKRAGEKERVMLTISEIMKLLPHRYPMLLVDRVVEIEDGKRIVGLKNVTANEQFFQGHFPARR